MFTNLTDDKTILNESFDDTIWNLSNDNYGYKKVSFDLDLQPDINIALKCYAVLKLFSRKNSAWSIYGAVNTIKKQLLSSNFLNPETVVEYQDYISTWTDTDKQSIYYFKEFIKFYNFENSDIYLNALNISIPPTGIRLLPNYSSILTFDYLLNDYIDNSTPKQREQFLPLLLWWKITKIIPMRPVEFSILERNCASYDRANDIYYLTIERKKVRNAGVKFKKIPILNKIRITKDVYDLIQEYISYVDPENTNERLLSYKSYHSFHANSTKGISLKNKLDTDVMSVLDLRKLLLKFYSKVIEDKYNYTVIEKEENTDNDTLSSNIIERIQLGDTRHLAFCSMMLQGFNPLTIAQIGGHYTLSEQMSYLPHLKTYIDAHTFLLAKSLREKMANNESSINIGKLSKESKIKALSLGDNYYSLRKVKGGRCMSNNFPYECINLDDCIFCEHFIMDETLTNNMLDILNDKVKKEIETKLEYIKGITLTLGVNIENGEYNIQEQENLKTQNNNLKSSINRKALIEAYTMKLREV